MTPNLGDDLKPVKNASKLLLRSEPSTVSPQQTTPTSSIDVTDVLVGIAFFVILLVSGFAVAFALFGSPQPEQQTDPEGNITQTSETAQDLAVL